MIQLQHTHTHARTPPPQKKKTHKKKQKTTTPKQQQQKNKFVFRRISGADQNSVLGRKDSGSVSTSVTPRWVPTIVPSTMPVYSLPPEPVLYAVPPPHYYLGHYTPKFIDAERMHVRFAAVVIR